MIHSKIGRFNMLHSDVCYKCDGGGFRKFPRVIFPKGAKFCQIWSHHAWRADLPDWATFQSMWRQIFLPKLPKSLHHWDWHIYAFKPQKLTRRFFSCHWATFCSNYLQVTLLRQNNTTTTNNNNNHNKIEVLKTNVNVVENHYKLTFKTTIPTQKMFWQHTKSLKTLWLL